MEKSVPPKEEVIIEVELTVPQKQYYRAIYEREEDLIKPLGSAATLAGIAMEFVKCCDHLFLVRSSIYFYLCQHIITKKK